MSPRAIWKGAISFGMVAIPIKMYIATEQKDIAFHNLHKECGSRLRMKRWCPEHDREVTSDEIVKGYEFAKDQYIQITDEDLDTLPVNSLRSIEITKFVELPSIDPVYYEKSYWLEPDSVGIKPYYLLKQALEGTNRVAVAKVSFRNREHLCCVRTSGKALIMETMYYPDEIRSTEELNLPEEKVKISAAELKMANTLIEQLAGTFEAEEHRDDYRETLERLIEGKLGNAAPMEATPEAPQAKVIDLMAALRASIEAAKQGKSATPPTVPHSNGKAPAKAVKPPAKRKVAVG